MGNRKPLGKQLTHLIGLNIAAFTLKCVSWFCIELHFFSKQGSMVQCWFNGLAVGTFILPSPTLILPSSSSWTPPLSESALSLFPQITFYLKLPSFGRPPSSHLFFSAPGSYILLSVRLFSSGFPLSTLNSIYPNFNLFLCSWFKDTIAQSLKWMDTYELLRLGCLIMSPRADFDFIVLGLANE